MSLAAFAAEQQLPLVDRTKVIDALHAFVTKRNVSFQKEEGVLKDPVNVRLIQYTLAGVVVTVLLFAAGAMFGWTVGALQLPLILALGFAAFNLVRLQNRMLEGGGPFYLQLNNLSSRDALPSSYTKLPATLQNKIEAFRAAFPEGVVHYGELMRAGNSIEPTSIRFSLGDETISVWSVTART